MKSIILILFEFLYVLIVVVESSSSRSHIDSSRIFRYGSNVFKSGKIRNSGNYLPSSPEEKLRKLPKVFNGKNINYELINGDMLVEKPIYSRKKRKIVNEYDPYVGTRTRWPNNILPYVIDSSVPDEVEQRLKAAIDHWHERTCIRFEVYDRVRHSNYKARLVIKTTNDDSLCASFVGYREDVRPVYLSDVFLGKDCSTGTIIHELGHAIGFRHEQSRTDRNEHIKINYNRISADFRGQYDVMESPQPGYYGVQYDLFSVMHYSSQGGTLEATDPKRTFLMGQRIGLSFLDTKLANLAYKCGSKCPNLRCQNEGFADQYCKCYCPDGFTGQFCETVIKGADPITTVKSDKSVNLECEFDNTLCSWSQDRLRASDDWSFSQASLRGFTETQDFFTTKEPRFKTGPQNGGDANGNGGTYIYLNSLLKTTKNANSILTSPQISVQSSYSFCLGFWYQMYADGSTPSYPLSIGNLTVRQLNSDGSDNILWQASGNQGINWQYGEAYVTLVPPASAVYFEATLDEQNYGDIALDKITVKNARCTSARPPLIKAPAPPTPSQRTQIRWSEWSSCSVTCGEGIQSRTRICPSGTSWCRPKTETRKCILSDCPIAKIQTIKPVEEVTWSDWNDWSSCSATCDKGYQYRVRVCLNQKIALCVGERTQYQDCFVQSCNVVTTAAAIETTEEEEIQVNRNLKLTLINETVDEPNENSESNETIAIETSNNFTALALDEQIQYEKRRGGPKKPGSARIETDEAIDACGGEFQLTTGQKIIIQSPNYPSQYGPNLRCNYYFKSPPGTKISARIIDIDLEESIRDTCIDSLEFRYFSLGQPGPMYCGRSTDSYKIDSYSNFILMVFRSNFGQSSRRRGFQVEATITGN